MTQAANDHCTCLEVYGEDPDCKLHGIETAWALKNTMALDWQQIAIEYRRIADTAERTAKLEGARLALEAAVKGGKP